MRKNYVLIAIPIIVIFLSSFILDKKEGDYSSISVEKQVIDPVAISQQQDRVPKSKVNQFISEVYGDYANDVIFQTPNMKKAIEHRLVNKVRYATVSYSSINSGKTYKKLSSIPLMTKYNSNLQRDLSFDPNNFNPLKYDFNFNAKSNEVYLVDNTNYIIIIGKHIN